VSFRFFQEEPGAIAIFGFTDEEIESDEEPFYQSKRFIDLAKNFVGVIDQVVDMLGPEMEMVGEVFVELSKQYKIEIGHYMLLGNLLLEELEDVLGPKAFTDHIKSCWIQVYQVLCADVKKKLTQAECDLKPPSTQFDDMGRRRRSLF